MNSTQNSFQKSEPPDSTVTIPQSGNRRVHRKRFEHRGQSRPLSHRGKSRPCGNKKGWLTKARLEILPVRNRAIDYRNHPLVLILLQLNLKIQTHSSGSSTLELSARSRLLHNVTHILIRQVFSDKYHFLFGGIIYATLNAGICRLSHIETHGNTGTLKRGNKGSRDKLQDAETGLTPLLRAGLCFYLMWPVRLSTKEPLLSLVKKSTDFLTSPLLHDDEMRLMGIVTWPPGGIVWSN